MTSAGLEPAIPVTERPQTCALNRTATGNGCRWHPFSFHGSTALVGQGLLTVEASGLHSRHATLGMAPLDEWTARCRHPYLTTHDIHKRQTSMLPEGFEPAIPTIYRTATSCCVCSVRHSRKCVIYKVWRAVSVTTITTLHNSCIVFPITKGLRLNLLNPSGFFTYHKV